MDDRHFSDVKIKLPTNDSSEKLLRIRHTEMNGGIFVLGLMLNPLEILTGKLFSLNLLLVLTGEGM